MCWMASMSFWRYTWTFLFLWIWNLSQNLLQIFHKAVQAQLLAVPSRWASTLCALTYTHFGASVLKTDFFFPKNFKISFVAIYVVCVRPKGDSTKSNLPVLLGNREPALHCSLLWPKLCPPSHNSCPDSWETDIGSRLWTGVSKFELSDG